MFRFPLLPISQLRFDLFDRAAEFPRPGERQLHPPRQVADALRPSQTWGIGQFSQGRLRMAFGQPCCNGPHFGVLTPHAQRFLLHTVMVRHRLPHQRNAQATQPAITGNFLLLITAEWQTPQTISKLLASKNPALPSIAQTAKKEDPLSPSWR